MKAIILGAGLVGGPMAIDLAHDDEFDVTVVDINETSLSRLKNISNINVVCKDLSNQENVSDLVQDFDLVLNAVPGFMGFQTLETIIKARKNVIDIAFFPEDPFQLDKLAKDNNVIAIMYCGIAPGMSNVLIGHVDNLLDETDSATIYVGGLPEVREWPYEYKAVFSPVDVIEEYTRPARYVVNNKLVIKPALSESELLNFPSIGTLEAFNSDGLRTLINTINAPDMKEKTLRYPGHIQKMEVFRETGFFSQEEIEINGTKIRPLDFTAKLLFPKWEMKKGEVDITIMRVIVTGKKAGTKKQYIYDLFDKYDKKTNTHSMARTTGYSATVALRMIAKGVYKKIGLSVPEYIGKYPECVDFMLQGLKERGVNFKETIS